MSNVIGQLENDAIAAIDSMANKVSSIKNSYSIEKLKHPPANWKGIFLNTLLVAFPVGFEAIFLLKVGTSIASKVIYEAAKGFTTDLAKTGSGALLSSEAKDSPIVTLFLKYAPKQLDIIFKKKIEEAIQHYDLLDKLESGAEKKINMRYKNKLINKDEYASRLFNIMRQELRKSRNLFKGNKVDEYLREPFTLVDWRLQLWNEDIKEYIALRCILQDRHLKFHPTRTGDYKQITQLRLNANVFRMDMLKLLRTQFKKMVNWRKYGEVYSYFRVHPLPLAIK